VSTHDVREVSFEENDSLPYHRPPPMPAPRTLEVARRSIETLRQLTSGDAPRTLIAEMVRAKIIAKMTRKKGLEPFHPASGMDTALAEALERGAVSP